MPTATVPAEQRTPPKPLPRPTRLPLYLTLAYVVLIAYASLYPFAKWRDHGLSPLAFLDAGWPRYWTAFDLAVNVVAYLPLGFLLALTLRHLSGRWTAAVSALLLGGLLSFSLEFLQNWLPSRVPSNLDLATNLSGAAIGAVVAVWNGKRIFRRIGQFQHGVLATVPQVELGLVLLGLWLMAQLSPETLLFATGDLRAVLDLPPAVPYAAPSFFVLETGVIACNTVVIGLFASTLLTEQGQPHPLLITALMLLALAIRTLATAVLVAPQEAFAWLTPGAQLGLLTGCALLSIGLVLSPPSRVALAGLALMVGTALVNLTPPNPYSEAALATWRQGHFLNFNGLTRWVASFWPFVALPYLTALARRL